MSREPVCGGILAGGAGRRFGGADKGWLAWRGTSFVEHVRDALAPQVDEVIISANRNQERYAALGHRVVGDGVGAGPAAGLLALMEAAARPWLLCVPCDALRLPPDLARTLAGVRRVERADVVVLDDGAGPQPTVCLVACALAPALRRYLAAGHTALWRWQARQRLALARIAAPLANVNDRAALAALAP